MASFDLHFHPSFKSFMSNDVESNRGDCWKVYDDFVNVVDSQSSLTQCEKGDVNIGVATFITLEPPYATSFLVQLAAGLSFFDKDMLNRPTGSGDLQYFKDELAHLEASVAAKPDKVKIIKDFSELDENKINLILAIEGAHSIASNEHNAEKNLRVLKQDNKYRFLYLTLVHQTRYLTCNHAFSVKLIAGNEQFWPQGHGLTPFGKELINTAYDKSIGGYQLLIDIKHMSIASRKEFYQYRIDQHHQNIPIIASHVGFTGISWKSEKLMEYIDKAELVNSDQHVRVQWKKPKGIQKPFTLFWDCEFNPWSLNLYDEEIKMIVDSGGLIGLILDRRVLGAQKVSSEFFDHQNYLALGLKLKRSREEWVEDQEQEDQETKYDEGQKDPMKRLDAPKHLWHLCNQILHAVKCAGPKAWDHLTLGSDFDGLIAAIKACISVEEYPYLEKNLIEMLPEVLKQAQKAHPGVDFGLNDVATQVKNIMYNNGRRFIKKHFTEQPQA